MGKVYAIVNQKGGVAKTTTAVSLASYLAAFRRKTLLIDIDPQGNATSGVGIDKNRVEHSIYEVLIAHKPIERVLLPTQIRNLDLVPSNIQLSGAQIELVNLESRETLLKRALVNIKEKYEYIIIDCPPSLGLLTINTLTASDEVLIPMQCEYYPLEGLGQLLNTIGLVQRNYNPSLKLAGVLLTMFDTRTNLSHQVAKEIHEYFGDKVYKTVIPRNVRLAEAPSFGKPILLYDRHCPGAKAYKKLAREIISQIKKE
ncbi:AAA family ATPase [bacterium]|nr:AAA family ATPase [bacterium]